MAGAAVEPTAINNKAETLAEYLQKHKGVEFVWGSNDCCTFASNWVEELTGVNPLISIGHYGKYKTLKGAATILKNLGGLSKVLDENLGNNIHPAYAKVGDIVMGDLDGGETLGICIGIECMFLGEKGVVRKRTLDMLKAWRT